MASNCFTPIRGRRLRATLVNTLGQPVYSSQSTVVTSGFVKVDMTSELETGEQIQVKAADGSLCVNDAGCDQLKWFNVKADFCSVDPDLFAMINQTWTKLADYQGNTIGWEESYLHNCDSGFSLEIWSDVTNFVPTDPNATGAWVYYLLPALTNGTIGDLTVENNAVTFTITGRSKSTNAWGKGPYNVVRNPPDGHPGPLFPPVSPVASRRLFLTTVAPPDPTCGAQPLSSPVGPAFTVNEVITDARRMSVFATLVPSVGTYQIDWGDGTPVQPFTPGTPLPPHVYGKEGVSWIKVWPTGQPQNPTFIPVTLPFTSAPSAPNLVVAEDTTDATRFTAKATIVNTGASTITWGDGNTNAVAAGGASASRKYIDDGVYLITVTDNASGVSNQVSINVPFGIVGTVAKDPGASPDLHAFNVVADNHRDGAVVIDWGDGSQISRNPGDGVTSTRHLYATGAPAQATITITDPNDPTATWSKQVAVPWAALAQGEAEDTTAEPATEPAPVSTLDPPQRPGGKPNKGNG